MTMKRSYDYSFVSHSPANNSNIIPISTRSFQYATQATRLNTSNIVHHYSYASHTQDPISASSNFIPHSRSSSTQSTASSFSRAPLTGLGITFKEEPQDSKDMSISPVLSTPSYPVSVPLQVSLNAFLTGPYSPLHGDYISSISFAIPPLLHENRTASYDMDFASPGVNMEDLEAYSSCPSDDYVARSPLDSRMDSPSDPLAFIANTLLDQMDADLPRPTSDFAMFSPKGEPLIGLFADVNFRHEAWNRISPQPCFNPALLTKNDDELQAEAEDIMDLQLEYPYEDDVQTGTVQTTEPSVTLSEAVDSIVSMLSASMAEQERDEAALTSVPAAPSVQARTQTPAPAPSVSRQRQHTNGQGLAMPAFATRSVKLEAATPIIRSPRTPLQMIRSPFADVRILNLPTRVATPPIFIGSPILNAHLGVSLDDLRRKADEFRMNNPGTDIDKAWLQAFAGRLSERGELLPDYRCYVLGCAQSNKRRDHILVHVGSHVEYRPFQCENCGMRFLRKNECKRHATSHDGIKPYVCTVCPPERNRSFVRQDLLKRHLKVTHRTRAVGEEDHKRIKLSDGCI
ncbi:unnamed protein product [Somion occarium]|uniref:C2H2-type domain-containing protein n=1 Tax=Somion occarium TaxID=3059160 RepID=A0ABP1D1M9_9APHY